MKYLFCWMLALAGMMGHLYAQEKISKQSNSATLTVYPYKTNREEFDISLTKGNKLFFLLQNLQELDSLNNLSTIINGFLTDMTAFKDSLQNPLTIKTIKYIIGDGGKTEIQIRQTNPPENSFFVNKGEVSALKTQQDTIRIVGTIYLHGAGDTASRYQLTFFLNHWDEISEYANGDLDGLADKIGEYVKQNTKSKNLNNNIKIYCSFNMAGDPLAKPKIYWSEGHPQSYSGLNASTTMQNYKNYFAPGINIGLSYNYIDKRNHFQKFGIKWEPLFFFKNNNQGVLQAYRNDFLSFEYGIKYYDAKKNPSFIFDASLGYLINRQGDFFNKNTFRIGIGGFIYKQISLQPVIYFDHFFKNVSPGIQLTVRLF